MRLSPSKFWPRYAIVSAVLGLIGMFLIIALWQFAASERTVWPDIREVVSTLQNNSQAVLRASKETALRVLKGAILGYTFGLIVAVMSHWSTTFRRIINWPIESIRPIPPVALTPFFISFFGISSLGQIYLIAVGVFMISYVSFLDSLSRTSPVLIRSAKTLGVNGLRLIIRVQLPNAWSGQLGTLRVAVAFALGLSVAAEFLGAREGLGIMIRNARAVLALDLIAACCIALALIGIVFDFAVRGIHRITAPWAYGEENK